jgi:streptogramin lyase
VKRSAIRSLLALAVAMFTILVTATVANAQTFPLTNPCPAPVAPAPPGGTCQPAGITAGPDGNIWFTEENGNRIGRITPGGAITEFGLPAGSLPVEITPGPDGALWFTEAGSNSIGRITTSGAITHRSVSGAPDGIVAGPDGNIWFTEPAANRIGKLAISGGSPTYFLSSSLNEPGDITVGPDNRLWFTQGLGGKIGAIPTSATGGGDISHFPSGGGLNDPSGITSSAGALWFTEFGASQVRRIDTSGNIGAPTPVGAGPSAIATGADGALWFTETIAGRIGRITPSGVLTNEFPASSPGAQPGGISAGPDGALWFTEFVGNNIGRLATAPPFVPPPPPPGPAPVASTKKKCKVPKLRNLTVKKARKKLRKAGCKFKVRGKGRVRSTVPKAGRTTTKRVIVKCKRKKAKRTGRRATAGGRLIASKGGL